MRASIVSFKVKNMIPIGNQTFSRENYDIAPDCFAGVDGLRVSTISGSTTYFVPMSNVASIVVDSIEPDDGQTTESRVLTRKRKRSE